MRLRNLVLLVLAGIFVWQVYHQHRLHPGETFPVAIGYTAEHWATAVERTWHSVWKRV